MKAIMVTLLAFLALASANCPNEQPNCGSLAPVPSPPTATQPAKMPAPLDTSKKIISPKEMNQPVIVPSVQGVSPTNTVPGNANPTPPRTDSKGTVTPLYNGQQAAAIPPCGGDKPCGN
eukprot:TRINITY_DN25390_c0_g1_i1.p1 TRINITY_DN25390_c0_g1~~TRINITY_DN25390_c0_g1_i1.p1  ORF type:complete len:137 (-),score=17.94 TRINITY_DN25390_c0_g1_i1:31-387(-)